MGFPWRNWTILPFSFEIFFFCWFHYMYYTLCLLWHVIHDNNNNSLMTDTDLTTSGNKLICIYVRLLSTKHKFTYHQ